MRLLVLGGTSFVGRHLVDAALAHGHEVTLFHRGRTNPHLFTDAEHRPGDRATGDYASLAEGGWDATVDVTAYVPRHVDQALDVLANRAGHYVLVSSVSAYDPARATPDEDSPRHAGPDPDTEQVTAETYGPLKAACERHVEDRLPDGTWAIVRPTYVVGPHDPTDRFTYWARVMDDGGRVPLAWPDAPLQVVDARDLAAFMLRLAESRRPGRFDGVGPHGPLREMLAELANPDHPYELVDVGAQRLAAERVTLPMVDGDPAAVPLMTRPGERARAAGLRTRPVAQTARDTVAWDRERGRPALSVGPAPEQRAALLGQAPPYPDPG
jgi:2'-hydroxyisoflavone reductase